MRGAIIGLDALPAAAWGSSVMAAQPGGTFEASQLPRSMAGIPTMNFTDVGTQVVDIRVQREIRPDRLMLSAEYTTGATSGIETVEVLSLKVGTIDINASPNPIPAYAFDPVAVGVSIRAPVTATPSVGIQLTVRVFAITAEDNLAINGVIFGPSAAPGAGAGGPAVVVAEGPVEGTVGAIVGADGPGGDVPQDANALPQSMVGLPPVVTVLGQRQYLNVQIFRDIRPDRLVLDVATAGKHLVNDIRVGTISLNCTMSPVPGTAFGPLVFGNRLRAVATATPSIGIGVELTRTRAASTNDTVARGGIFGPSRYAST